MASAVLRLWLAYGSSDSVGFWDGSFSLGNTKDNAVPFLSHVLAAYKNVVTRPASYEKTKVAFVMIVNGVDD